MDSMRPNAADAASFRDPSGYVYRDDQGRLCRQVNSCYMDHFRLLFTSGLYQELTTAGLMVEHSGSDSKEAQSALIFPREIPFVSYPYEWPFSMLKEAALLTLRIQKRAIERGLSLKDASAYNVQFEGTQPIFIDTLSFEPLQSDRPWVAYAQFCRHFLAPLALMSRTDVRLSRLLTGFIDGVPLDLAVRMLPRRSFFNLGLFMHLRLHASAVSKHQQTQPSGPDAKASAARLSARGLQNLIEHLERTVQKLHWKPVGTEWVNYYQDNSYTEAMHQEKTRWVAETLQRLKPSTVWDLGANTGLYSRVARETGAYVVALDIDPGCVERNFLDGRERKEKQVLPLCMDLTNPSTGLGWAHQERRSLTARGPAECILALALVHHLAIGNNVPFEVIADWFGQLGRQVIVEFVPKDDPQTQRLLRSREDVFPEYTQQHFEKAFGKHFRAVNQQSVPGSGRILYHFQKS